MLRPGGWVGLYDHYFMGEMIDVPEFGEWAALALERYPLPPRNPQVGDRESVSPAGFEAVDDEFFVDDIELTHEQFCDYQLTISTFVAAASTRHAAIRAPGVADRVDRPDVRGGRDPGRAVPRLDHLLPSPVGGPPDSSGGLRVVTLTVGVNAPMIRRTGVAPETEIRPGAEWKPETPDGFTDVTYEISDGIAKITICRPEVRNAFRPRTLFELRDAFELARDDPDDRRGRAHRRRPRGVLFGW